MQIHDSKVLHEVVSGAGCKIFVKDGQANLVYDSKKKKSNVELNTFDDILSIKRFTYFLTGFGKMCGKKNELKVNDSAIAVRDYYMLNY